MAGKKPKRPSLRIFLDEETMKFLNEYKEEYGVSLQFFIEEAVKSKITNVHIQQELGEI